MMNAKYNGLLIEAIECTPPNSDIPLYSVKVNGEVIFECMSAIEVGQLTLGDALYWYEESRR